MGIKGLLPALKEYIQPVHISKYSGKRVGVDAYSWLHKGAYACSMEVCEQKGPWKATRARSTIPPYVSYCMHRVKLLQFNNITPVVVFDGGYLPLKAATEDDRRRRREMNLEQARLKMSQGNIDGANELFQRAVDVSPAMANELIKVLRAEGVEFVVAPYEADAQLAWLAKLDSLMGGVSAVISEDSDLIAYGCPVVVYKMDKYGNGEEIRRDALFSPEPGTTQNLPFCKFTDELFLGMCVLAGCDFLPSIPGIGLKKAHSLVLKYLKIDRVLSILRLEKKELVSEGYCFEFKQAMSIFLHARVYDARKRALTFLTPLPKDFEESCGGCTDFLGPDLPPSRAKAIAMGRMDPITMFAFDEDCSIINMPSTTSSEKWICSPTSVLETTEVVELSDGEDTEHQLLVTGRPSSKSQINEIAGVGGFSQPMFNKTSHVTEGSSPPPLDQSFVTHLKLIATDIKAKCSEEHEKRWWESGDLQEGAAVIPQNNPFKKKKVDRIPFPEQTNDDSEETGRVSSIGFRIRDLPQQYASDRSELLAEAKRVPTSVSSTSVHEDMDELLLPSRDGLQPIPSNGSFSYASCCSPMYLNGTAERDASIFASKENLSPGEQEVKLTMGDRNVLKSSSHVIVSQRKPLQTRNEGETFSKKRKTKKVMTGGGILKFFQPVSRSKTL
ncbi:unnamed protein product [Sphagnum troendelagicum]